MNATGNISTPGVSSCALTNSVLQTVVQTEYMLIYFIGTPTYFVLAIIGHVLVLFALYDNAKTEKAYNYQIFRAISSSVLVIVGTTYKIGRYWWLDKPYFPLFDVQYTSCYPCMWYTAHLASPLANSMGSVTSLLTICMCADRVYALAVPMKYKNLNKRPSQLFSVIFSLSVGFSASVFDCFRFYVDGPTYSDGRYRYTLKTDREYLQSRLAISLAMTRVGMQILSIVILIVLNCALSVLYSAYLKKSRNLKAATSMLPSNQLAQESRRKDEKLLTSLTIAECCFTSVGNLFLIVYYIILYIFPSFYACYEGVLTPLLDGTKVSTNLIEFIVIYIFNGSFRKMLINSLRRRFTNCVSGITSSTVVHSIVHNNN